MIEKNKIKIISKNNLFLETQGKINKFYFFNKKIDFEFFNTQNINIAQIITRNDCYDTSYFKIPVKLRNDLNLDLVKNVQCACKKNLIIFKLNFYYM